MRMVRCYECKKRYDFDVDDFCPRCGAFTQPPRQSRIGADGTVVRADGINERNHKESFVHAELHQENRKRGGTPREGTKRPASSRRSSQTAEKKQSGKIGLVIGWVVTAVVLLNLLGSLLSCLL